jgi:uncharacterized protein YyaL (SSP411 family)
MARLLPLAGLFLVLPLFAADPPPADKEAKPKHTNRLARETSPYLLQHAHNPVDWYPWGEEAFAKAKKENKLVFLSIGYSSCHWCHVMERESFENEEVAKILNEHFVCIKVDREERPDIDHVYMTALGAMGQRGGWPLSMWLTADGKPIIGGTYWPREDKEIDGEKVRGFKTLLTQFHEIYTKHPKEVQQQADDMAKATTEALAGDLKKQQTVELDVNLLSLPATLLKAQFDPEHGGFGNPTREWRGTKFPTPPLLLFLQREAARTGSKDLSKLVDTTLDHMAQGGIYDHLGGGFHRYSTERTWTVPHFEKMLYDNAQLLEVYATAYRETKKPLYRRTLQQTIAFVRRELTAPEGGFYCALDADSEGEEGRCYVWTTRELDALLTDEAERKLFKDVYGANKPNFEEKYHILVLQRPLADVAAELKTTEDDLEKRLTGLRARLFAVREKRPKPFLDTKVLTGWNGQMIAGLAVAGDALGDKEAIETARKAADFVLKNLRDKDGRLRRTWGAAPGGKAEARLNGYLDDYAYLVHGLLCLHDVTGEARWLEEAKALTETMIRLHGDKDKGAFFSTSADHEMLFARAKDQYDGAQPSGNSTAARNLVRLWIKTKDERYAREAERTFKALAGALKDSPTGLTTLAEAFSLYLEKKP